MEVNQSVTVEFDGVQYVAETQARYSIEDYLIRAERMKMFTGTPETREAKARNLHKACVDACKAKGIVPVMQSLPAEWLTPVQEAAAVTPQAETGDKGKSKK